MFIVERVESAILRNNILASVIYLKDTAKIAIMIKSISKHGIYHKITTCEQSHKPYTLIQNQ